MSSVEWGKYKIGDLFEVKRGLSMYVNDKNSFTYVLNSHPNAIRLVQQLKDNNGVVSYVDRNNLPKKFKSKVEKAGQITINPDQPMSFYQDKEFIGNSVIIIDTSNLSKNICLYLVGEIQRIRRNSTWNDKFPKEQVKVTEISLPCKDGNIDYDFMESLISELGGERISELEAYLQVTGLDNYELTEEEKNALSEFDNIQWQEFNIKELFGKSNRGKRLKSLDRISGTLPFVTAGEENEGISDFIGNKVEVFNENTITIDMFGSAKYRNYKYGADDHIAIVHTEKLDKYATIFVTSAIHKSSHNGQFNYGKNFYAKDADGLYIKLPVIKDKPNYNYMSSLISAIQKLVIKDVVLYKNKKIKLIKKLVEKMN